LAGRIPWPSPGAANAPNVHVEHLGLRGSEPPQRDVVPNIPEATIWRDSGARVRVDASTCSVTQAGLSTAPEVNAPAGRLRERLTVVAARIEWFPRAAPKRRHVLFSGPAVDASALMRALRPGLTLSERHDQ